MAKSGGSVVFKFEGDDKNVKSTAAKLGDGIKSAATASAAAVGALSAAITGVVTAGVNSYASLEQNVGGIETLFKESANTVIANAKKAYETAGMSANEYMETVTSFSARLLQGLGGDTEKAAQVADTAVQDMSDNANKMGTSIEMIQNAYQGFAKQNYTMLDNLKLGYGGTATEMARLINDSGVLGKSMEVTAETVNDVSFDKMIEAIHVIQDRMGITGTTAKEAATTITGSMNSAKAAFDNFLNGTGDVQTLADSLLTAFGNIGKAVGKLAPDILDGLVQLFDGLVPQIPGLIQNFGPSVVSGAMQLINSLTASLPQIATALVTSISQIFQLVIPQIPVIAQNLLTALLNIGQTLIDQLPILVPQIVSGIIGLLDVFNEHFDDFLMMGGQLILGLIQGLINSIPQILENLPTILMAILNFFTASKLLSAGVTLIKGLGTGLINGIPNLVSNIPKLISSLVNGIKNNGLKYIVDVGKNLVEGLWSGISGSFTWIKDKIKGWVGNVLNFVKGLFGIHSPSTEFAYVGKMNVMGLEEGMEDMKGDLNATIDDMVDLSPSLIANASNSYSPNLNVIVNNQFETDPLGQVVNRIKTVGGGARSDYNVGMGATNA